MPDTGKSEAVTTAREAAKDKVGDLLRKERLTRRITIETIAKDLKLNVGYIKALEASEYEKLPADPYVRVYIKSLTKYLSLDSDTIMKEFYRERGMIAAEETDTSNKIDISVKRQERNPTVVVVAALIVVLAIFAFIANRKGWLAQPQEGSPAIAVEEKADSADIDHEARLKQIEDSLLAISNAPETTAMPAPTPAPATKTRR